MTPIAIDFLNTLLKHHRDVCLEHQYRPPIIDRCTITYKQLCERSDHPGLEAGVGPYLGEVAKWCADSKFPPINSLAVNRETRMPGSSYDIAAGCSLLNWPTEVESAITFKHYPVQA